MQVSIVSLDGPSFSGLAWSFKLLPSKTHRDQHMILQQLGKPYVAVCVVVDDYGNGGGGGDDDDDDDAIIASSS
jgi:hypothetical protein